MKQRILIISIVFYSLLKTNLVYSQQWYPLGTGLIGSGQYDRVNTLCNDSLHNRLWAAGIFQIAGSDSVHNVAWWDGVNWHPLQSIVVSGDTLEYGLDMKITSSIMFHNKLLFSIDKSLALNRWLLFELNEDSISNRFIGSFSKDINAMCIYHDTLYVAGEFSNYQSVPAGTTINVNRIAKWNGTDFVPVGSGIGAGGIVYDLCVYNNKLIAAGYFETAGGTYCKNIAAWDGTLWSAIGNGLGQAGTFDVIIHSAETYKNKLYVGGNFDFSSTFIGQGLIYWNGSNWNNAGGDFGDVRTIKVYNDKLYAGPSNFILPVNEISYYDDTIWHSMGYGPSDDVLAIEEYNGSIYAGGKFLNIQNPPIYAGYVARFDPTIIQDTTGIEINSANENEINIYPNPAENKVQIEVKGVEANEKINLELYDLFGRKITSQEFISSGEINRYLLNLNAEITAGIYMLRFRNNNEQRLIKLIIQK